MVLFDKFYVSLFNTGIVPCIWTDEFDKEYCIKLIIRLQVCHN